MPAPVDVQPFCVECGKYRQASGSSTSSRYCRALGLCRHCYSNKELRTKWKEKLGVGDGRGRTRKKPRAEGMSATLELFDSLDARIEALAQVLTEVDELHNDLIASTTEALCRGKALRVKLVAAHNLESKMEASGYELDLLLRHFGMSIAGLKDAIKAKRVSDKAHAKEVAAIKEEQKEKREGTD